MAVTRLSPPPRIKVLEGLGAIADGRVHQISDKRCKVVSSEGGRVYDVYIDLERGYAYSNDNGTVYRNYIGYPLISFMMLKGVLPFDPSIAEKLRDIRWKTLNENYKKYYLVEEHVKRLYIAKGGDINALERLVSDVLTSLKGITLLKLEAIPED